MTREYPPDWNTRRKKVYRRDGYTCQNCGAKGGPHGNTELHAHHIVPKSQGGTHKLENLQTLCARCHDAAHEKNMAITAPEIGKPCPRFFCDGDAIELVSGGFECEECGTEYRERNGSLHKKSYVKLHDKYGPCPQCGADYALRQSIIGFNCTSCWQTFKEIDGELLTEEERLQRKYGPCPVCSETESLRKSLFGALGIRCKACRTRFKDVDGELLTEAERLYEKYGSCPHCDEAETLNKSGTFRRESALFFWNTITCSDCGEQFKEQDEHLQPVAEYAAQVGEQTSDQWYYGIVTGIFLVVVATLLGSSSLILVLSVFLCYSVSKDIKYVRYNSELEPIAGLWVWGALIWPVNILVGPAYIGQRWRKDTDDSQLHQWRLRDILLNRAQDMTSRPPDTPD